MHAVLKARVLVSWRLGLGRIGEWWRTVTVSASGSCRIMTSEKKGPKLKEYRINT